MGLPPFAGGVKNTAKKESPAPTVIWEGASGTVAGESVTCPDNAPGPAAFTPRIVTL